MKVARTVQGGGKAGDDFKGLPIAIKTAEEWAREETELGVPDDKNTYKKDCACCHEPFPPTEPLYVVKAIHPNNMCQFKLICHNCAYKIAKQLKVKVIEPEN